MFPIDPNAPGGPDRSESLRHSYHDHTLVRRAADAPTRPAGCGMDPVARRLTAMPDRSSFSHARRWSRAESFPTPLCRTLGLAAPIVQAPIGSAATPELAAAVSNAGGLGMLALTWTPAESVAAKLRATRELTDRPFGVNLILEWEQHERLTTCLAASVAVVSTFWGDPSPYVEAVHASGALHMHTVSSVEEAQLALEAGVDVIVTQGWEAGGRVRGQIATLPLVPAVLDAVRPVPVIAAGGVADGRGLAAVLALGADAAWVGTRFLLAEEAGVHPEWRRRIRDASDTTATYTTAFDGGWPDAPHRVLRNSTLDAWERAGRPARPTRPGEGELLAHAPDGTALYRYDATPPMPGVTGDVEALALYAGQSAAIVDELQPAAQIVDQMVTGALAMLEALTPPIESRDRAAA
jgi:NAD(P)H-dependent flavin oxidoreductase YrpB (nitropropane dioxygenase family)